ncbi:MAG: metal ABC transporter ATP-binding protein [Gemmataceae bacterium]
MPTSIIDVHDLNVAYHRKPALWDVDFTIDEPALVGVIGPNGAGKSTLLKAMLGLVPLASGYVHIFGKAVSQQRNKIGYVPQRGSIDWDFPVSVREVVLMGTYGTLGWFRRPGRKEKAWADECIERVGLEEFRERQIGQLSGGQQQRTFLARALAQRAEIYFMDEPLAGVDAKTEKTIFSLLKELRENGKTVVVVHHDLRTVSQYFDYVILLNVRLIAHGLTLSVFHDQNLQKTYGGRLAILETAGEAIRARKPTQ